MEYNNLWEYALDNGWYTTEDPKILNYINDANILCTMEDNLDIDNSYRLGYTINNIPSNLNVDSSLPLEQQVAIFNAFFGAIN